MASFWGTLAGALIGSAGFFLMVRLTFAIETKRLKTKMAIIEACANNVGSDVDVLAGKVAALQELMGVVQISYEKKGEKE